MVSEVLDWNGRPLRVVRSRGGVTAICDIRRAVLHDGPWPAPALKRKIKRSAQLTAFDRRAAEQLIDASGFYCDLQSMNSEDAMTWSFFGPFLNAPDDARARLLNWLLELAGTTEGGNRECEIHLWKRLAHPDTGKTSHGPEPDFALFGDRALVLGEAKWTAKEDTRQGVLGTTSQMQMRRDSLAAEAATRNHELQLLALGVVLAENLEPPPPVAEGAATRIIEWEELAEYAHHPKGEEFRRYYEWKISYLQ